MADMRETARSRNAAAAAARDAGFLDPGEHLRQEMTRLGFDQGALAQEAGVSRQTVNNIINGRQNISRAMAAKLGRLMGRGADYWLAARFPVSGAPAAGRGASVPAHGGVSILVDHQIVDAVHRGIFVIDPFVEANARSASIDLTLDDFVVTAGGESIDISDSDYVLRAGAGVTVNTRENIEFPVDHMGRVGAMTEYARYGIIVAHGFQVDPGFRGHLQFSLFNAGAGDFKLAAGRRIISLEICRLGAVPRSAHAGTGAPIGERREEIQRYFRIKDAASVCARPVFDHLRSLIAVDNRQARKCARLDELEIEMSSADEAVAVDGVVRGALDALRTRLKVGSSGSGDVIVNFFAKQGRRIHLTGDEVRAALSVFRVETVGSGDSVFVSRHGPDRMLAIPPQDAEISLQHFAGQLGIDTPAMILLMAGLMGYGELG